jgi:hypothetical protein
MLLISLRGFEMRNVGILAGAAALLCATSVFAGDTPPAPELQIYIQEGDGEGVTYTPGGSDPDGDGVYEYDGEYQHPTWGMDFNILADSDPFVNSVIGFTNNSGVDQDYTIIVNLPTIAIPGGSLMGGSVGGSVTDSNFSGAASVTSTGGAAIFTGLVDGLGAPGATLLNDPFATAPVGFAGGTSVFGPASFGLPGPTAPGPAVAGSIGIQLKFRLTAGDSVAMTSFFIVEPIPAPAGIALFGIAAIVGRRRRR